MNLTCYRNITIFNSNDLNEKHVHYNINEFINYILEKSKVVNDAMRNEWFYHVKQLFQQVRFLIQLLYSFNLILIFFTFQKKYKKKLPNAESKKKQTTFFNFVAHVMQMHYKAFIQKTIREYTKFMSDPEVIYIIIIKYCMVILAIIRYHAHSY